MATRQEQVNAALLRLSNNLGSDMAGAVAVSLDGIVLASMLSAGVNADRVGAVAATIVGVARRVSNELTIGVPEETILKAANGLFMVLPAGDQSLLAVNIKQQANLGMVRIEAREAAAEIAKIL
jgi:uncharacterized protein